jgi:hypothetical protein
MRSYVLYSALKNYIKTKWPEQYISAFVDYNKDNDLCIKTADITPLRSMLNGRKYNGRLARVHFTFVATQSDEDFWKNRTFLYSLEEYMLALQNQYIVTEPNYAFDEHDEIIHIDEPTASNKGILIGIRSTDLIKSIEDAGKSPDGRPVFTITLSVTYYIGGNKE